jgi:hypothetical protein
MVVVGAIYSSRVECKGSLSLKSLCLPALETTVRCRVAACATLRGDAATIAQWRKQPIVIGAETMPISFLKHSEDQTILALKTVLHALEQRHGKGCVFADWGVIAAPNLFGRVSIAQTLQRYQQEGAWGVSPHLIPHQSLHAMSGTISQALKAYGPNFGIGGGPNSGPDAFLIASALMMDHQLPGLWVVLTGYESEWIPAADGLNPTAPVCQAVALALTHADANDAGLSLSFGQSRLDAEHELNLTHLPEFQLGLLAEELSSPLGQPHGKWRLADSHWLELETVIRAAEDRP